MQLAVKKHYTWVFLLALLPLTSCVYSVQSGVQVATKSTTYTGQMSDHRDDVIVFRGIPFAQPPTGENRWMPPQPLDHLPSTVSAQEFKPACYQDAYNIDWYQDVAAYFGHDLDMVMPPVSEDCLYLNIWKPKDVGSEPLPVIVWIHGGSNKAGWSYEPNYLGHHLAAKGELILVSIAYRLGVFGFMAHPELNQLDDKTNFGILDQIAALTWVQENIGFFGGDENNVTLMGESAGAANIGYLMATPKAAGLFQKAISQSGGFQMMADFDLEKASEFGAQLSTQLEKNLAALKAASSETVWQSASRVDPDYDYRALVDGTLFEQSPANAFRQYASVDLLIGSNEHEFYMYQDPPIIEPSLALISSDEKVNKALLARFETFSDKREGQDWLDTFLYMQCPSILMAQLVNQNGRASWVYQFERIRSDASALKAYHGAEIPYVFNTHDDWLPTTIEDQKVTEAMQANWINFAYFSDPNGQEKIPNQPWPAFSSLDPRFIRFDSEVSADRFDEFLLCRSLWPDYLK